MHAQHHSFVLLEEVLNVNTALHVRVGDAFTRHVVEEMRASPTAQFFPNFHYML